MAYVNVAEWKTEQVCEWLKGLDNSVLPYVHSFTNNKVSGQQLLSLRPEDLEQLGVLKLGHQEIILEAVEYLRNFHYELDRENLQLLALRLSCQAHSLHNELSRQTDSKPVTTQTLSDVVGVVTAVKPLVRWLDRPPFSGQLEYNDRKTQLLKLSIEMATCAQRDRFAEKPIEEIRTTCGELAKLADYVIQDIADPMILQPASLDLATLKKRPGDDLGFYILPSFHGTHQIAEIKFSSIAHQCGKMEEGDEIVQVNYQTVVGWERKNVLELFNESPTEVLLTLKRRPRHTKVYGQIYIKPYRLPSNKKTPYATRWQHNLPSPRPELLTIPDFTMPLPRQMPKDPTPEPASIISTVMLDTIATDSSDSDSEIEPPLSVRLYASKPRSLVQRRATITGASPTTKHAVDIEEFWRELKQEHSTTFQLRDKAASCAHGLDSVPSNLRPQTCLGIETKRKKKFEEEKKASDCESSDIKERKINEINSNSIKIEDNSCENEIINCDTNVPLLDKNANNDNNIGDKKCEKMKKDRGKLDKSYSTPAYDLTELIENNCTNSIKLFETDNNLINGEIEEIEGNVAQRINLIEEKLRINEDQSLEIQENFINNSFLIENKSELIDNHKEEDNAPVIPEKKTELNANKLNNSDFKENLSPQMSIKIEKRATPPEPPPRKYFAKPSPLNLNIPPEKPKILEKSEPKKVQSFEGYRDFAEKSTDFIDDPTTPITEKRTLIDHFGYSEIDRQLLREEKPVERYELFTEKFGTSLTLKNEEIKEVPRSNDSPDGAGSSVHSQEKVQDFRRTLEKDKSAEKGVVNRAMMVARSIGLSSASKLSSSSPRSSRKRNILLAKRRNVSVKEIGIGDLEGWLTYRSRGARGAWARSWFILKGSSLYRFKNQESIKSDCLIVLPGFTACQANEVKSRKFAFKVYHTGTVFYFAADNEDILGVWLEAINKATFGADGQNRTSGLFSETDESDGEGKGKIKNTEVKVLEKGFGSLKKLGRKDSGGKEQDIGGASLDRKYLRFLGTRTQNVPVPTAQFRSYRRVLPTSTPNKKIESPAASPDLRVTIAGSTFYGLSASHSATDVPSTQDMPDYRQTTDRRSQSTRIRRPDDLRGFVTLEEFMLSHQDDRQRSLTNRSVSPRSTHLSNDHVHLHYRQIDDNNIIYTPNRGFTSDFANNGMIYGHPRNGEEPPNINRPIFYPKTPGRSTPDRHDGIYASKYTRKPQEDLSYYELSRERLNFHHLRDDRVTPQLSRAQNSENSYPERRIFIRENGYSGSSGDLTCCTSATLQRVKKEASVSRKGSFNLNDRHRNEDKSWIDSLRRSDKKGKLKNVAQYQPPPIPSSPFEEGMRAAFEMHLDKEHVQKTSRLKSLFGSKSPQKSGNNLDLSREGEKTLLGSPRLHRALFRDRSFNRRNQGVINTTTSGRSGSQSPGDSGISQSISSYSGISQGHTLSQSFSSVSSASDWSPDTPPVNADKGISTGKRNRNLMNPPTLPYIPPPSSPPPPDDYPGLEYPPVFEPGTYSLSDASLLRARGHAQNE